MSDPIAATLPADVFALLEELLTSIRLALGRNLLGLYLRGSLALGDFDPETSDVDVLIVTRTRVTETEFEALRAMHERLRALTNRCAEGLEVAYFDAEAARRWTPGQRHPTITSHDPLRWEKHESNWLFDRWMARESGIALYGPDPREVFDAISDEELREAARLRLADWARWAAAVPADERAWLNERAHQAYVVETISRALYTLSYGRLSTKPEAVSWALQALPKRWRTLAERSRVWRSDHRPDSSTVPGVLQFIAWAAAQAGRQPVTPWCLNTTR